MGESDPESSRTKSTHRERIRALGVDVDAITLDQAVTRIQHWLPRGNPPCRFVVTPNLDHAVMLRESEPFRKVYADAALIIADGMPMVWASWLGPRPLRERVAGSDLVPALFRAGLTTGEELRVYLLGAAPGVAEQAAENVRRQFQRVTVVGTHSPERGFERDEAANAAIIERINRTEPHLLVIGLGAPKQELWIHQHATELDCGVAVCAGATIDFLAGHRWRAPRWMQRTGSEWLYRALTEPRRLGPRYLRDAMHLPSLLYGDWRAGRVDSR